MCVLSIEVTFPCVFWLRLPADSTIRIPMLGTWSIQSENRTYALHRHCWCNVAFVFQQFN